MPMLMPMRLAACLMSWAANDLDPKRRASLACDGTHGYEIRVPASVASCSGDLETQSIRAGSNFFPTLQALIYIGIKRKAGSYADVNIGKSRKSAEYGYRKIVFLIANISSEIFQHIELCGCWLKAKTPFLTPWIIRTQSWWMLMELISIVQTI